MLNLLWMAIVGAVIGVVASMFIQGSRASGMGWTIVLGAGGYALGGFLAYSFHWSTLVQWICGIAASTLLLTWYLMVTAKRE